MASGCHFFSLTLSLSLSGRNDFRFLNLAECVKGRRRDRKDDEMLFLAVSSPLFNFSGAVSCRSELSMQAFLSPPTLPGPGISCLCHINFMWTGRRAAFDVLCVDFIIFVYARVPLCVCFLSYLIQLTDLSA